MKLIARLALAAALLPVPLQAQPGAPAASVAQPNAALAAGEKLLAALQGDAAARRSFVESGFSTSALANEPAAERAAALDQLAAASGGLALAQSFVRSDRHADLVLATRGGHFVTAVVFTSSKEPGKISGLFFLPARDPAKVAREAWPAAPIPPADLASEIDWRVAAQARDGFFYGTVLVARGDDIVLRRAYGLANRETNRPNTVDTRFHSASVGKMFTAAAILKLAGQGRLALDDSLAKWVPEYPDAEAARKITLHQLLTHTAGLADWPRQFEPHASQREAARTMTAPLASEPGARMSYSNAGYVLLGAVVEAATGTPFATALDRLVFKPAGMTRTSFTPTNAVADRAVRYVRADDDPVGFKTPLAYTRDDHLAGDASGGAYTTADDLFAFHRALVGGRLLDAKLTAAALAPKVDFPGTPRPSRYGYGQRFGDCSGRAVFGHSGGGPNAGVSNATYATTDGEWTVIVLSNTDSAGEELAISICEAVARR